MIVASVLIVNYNGGELVLRCVDSIYAGLDDGQVEVIVVDNASQDGSQDALAARFPSVRLERNRDNVGFPRAVNQALRLAGGPLLILLNNDAYFLPGALARLIAQMDAHPEAAAIGPKVLNPDGSVQPSCFNFPTLRDIAFESFYLSRLFPRSPYFNRLGMGGFGYDRFVPVDWVLGACMAVRRSAVDAVGPMDERYFMYSEELDWCRAMAKARMPIYYWPEPTVVHYGQTGQESRRIRPEILALGFRSRYAYFDKHHGARYATWVRWLSVAGIALRLLAVLPGARFGRNPERRRQAGAYLAVLKVSTGRFPPFPTR